MFLAEDYIEDLRNLWLVSELSPSSYRTTNFYCSIAGMCNSDAYVSRIGKLASRNRLKNEKLSII